MMDVDVSIVIVTYNTREVTHDCIRSIMVSGARYSREVIVVDNCSSDGTVEYLKERFPEITIIGNKTNEGFSKGNNRGIRVAKGKYVLLLNSDTLVFEDSIDNLVSSAMEQGYDICGPVLLNADHSIQRSWFNYPSPLKIFIRFTGLYLVLFKLSKSRIFRQLSGSAKPAFMIGALTQDTRMDYLSFACILIRRNVLEEMGPLDEGLTFYHEDCEYGLRARDFHHTITYTVTAKVVHLGGTSSMNTSIFALENDVKGVLRVFKKYYPARTYRLLKCLMLAAFWWRTIGWYFGFYRRLRKFGLYQDSSANRREEARETLKAYGKIRSIIRHSK